MEKIKYLHKQIIDLGKEIDGLRRGDERREKIELLCDRKTLLAEYVYQLIVKINNSDASSEIKTRKIEAVRSYNIAD
jgi:hypothetical protein